MKKWIVLAITLMTFGLQALNFAIIEDIHRGEFQQAEEKIFYMSRWGSRDQKIEASFLKSYLYFKMENFINAYNSFNNLSNYLDDIIED